MFYWRDHFKNRSASLLDFYDGAHIKSWTSSLVFTWFACSLSFLDRFQKTIHGRMNVYI